MMPSRLDTLLASLDPDRTLNEVARCADEAMNTFTLPSARITDWEAFRRCLVGFHRHVERTILRLTGEVSGGMDFDWGRCCQILAQAFGPNGEKAAFEMARTGVEGGLYAVLKKTAQAVADSYAENEPAARITAYWNELSTDEKLAAPDEYLRKYGHLLPSEVTEDGADRVRANFPRVLREHLRMMDDLRRIGRT